MRYYVVVVERSISRELVMVLLLTQILKEYQNKLVLIKPPVQPKTQVQNTGRRVGEEKEKSCFLHLHWVTLLSLTTLYYQLWLQHTWKKKNGKLLNVLPTF